MSVTKLHASPRCLSCTYLSSVPVPSDPTRSFQSLSRCPFSSDFWPQSRSSWQDPFLSPFESDISEWGEALLCWQARRSEDWTKWPAATSSLRPVVGHLWDLRISSNLMSQYRWVKLAPPCGSDSSGCCSHGSTIVVHSQEKNWRIFWAVARVTSRGLKRSLKLTARTWRTIPVDVSG